MCNGTRKLTLLIKIGLACWKEKKKHLKIKFTSSMPANCCFRSVGTYVCKEYIFNAQENKLADLSNVFYKEKYVFYKENIQSNKRDKLFMFQLLQK